MDDFSWVGFILLGIGIGWVWGSVQGHFHTVAKIDELAQRLGKMAEAIDKDFTDIAITHEAFLEAGERVRESVSGFEHLQIMEWKDARRIVSRRVDRIGDGYNIWP